MTAILIADQPIEGLEVSEDGEYLLVTLENGTVITFGRASFEDWLTGEPFEIVEDR